VPAIEGVPALLADDRSVAGGSGRNRAYAHTFTSFDPTVDEVRRRLLCDAMTSGGLLAAVPPGAAMSAKRIGRLVEGAPGALRVVE